MILYVCLLRTEDALPLCATNDFNQLSESKVKEGKRIIKLLTKVLQNHSSKLCIQGDDITLHCVMDKGISFICVCEANYPHILAYGLLDELVKEFSLLYTTSVVKSMKRPFAIIEFGSYLQKVQQKYSSSRYLSRLNLSDLTDDLNLYPPTYMNVGELEPQKVVCEEKADPHSAAVINNRQNFNGSAKIIDSVEVEIKLQLKPVPLYGKIAILLALLCVCLDGYRGIVSLNSFSIEDDDGPSILHGTSFLIEMILLCVQISCLCRYFKYRKLVALGSFLSLLLMNFMMVHIREGFIVVFYVIVSLILLLATVKRTFDKCLPRFSV